MAANPERRARRFKQKSLKASFFWTFFWLFAVFIGIALQNEVYRSVSGKMLTRRGYAEKRKGDLKSSCNFSWKTEEMYMK